MVIPFLFDFIDSRFNLEQQKRVVFAVIPFNSFQAARLCNARLPDLLQPFLRSWCNMQVKDIILIGRLCRPHTHYKNLKEGGYNRGTCLIK
jgi:hypothetical protein